MDSVKRALVVSGGHSREMHHHLLRLYSEFLKTVEPYAVDGLMCGRAVTACTFQCSTHQNIDEPLEWGVGCSVCSKQTRSGLALFCENIIDQAESVTPEDRETVRKLLSELGGVLSTDDYLAIEYDGIPVGVRAFEDFQYFFHCGRPDTVHIAPGTAAYEYLFSAVLQTISARRILESYSVIMVIDAGKAFWGVWADVAFAMNRQVLSCFVNELLRPPPKHYEMLAPLLHEDSTKFRLRYSSFPGMADIASCYGYTDSFARMQQRGKDVLAARFPKALPPETVRSRLGVPGEKKIVGVFTHLSWDNSMTYGDSLVKTFEEWLEVTLEVARRKTDVQWVLKLHPGELVKHAMLNHPDLNTLSFLKRVLADKPDHITILDDPTLTSADMAQVISVGVTMSGTVCYELPAMGVPCLNIVRGIHSRLGFTRESGTLDEYRHKLLECDTLCASEDERSKALAYIGLLYEPRMGIDAQEVFADDGESLNVDDLPGFVETHAARFKELIRRKF